MFVLESENLGKLCYVKGLLMGIAVDVTWDINEAKKFDGREEARLFNYKLGNRYRVIKLTPSKGEEK